MSPERLRVGIIGASVNAMWGPRAHVPAVQALPEFELAAVCTAHPETAAESAAKFGARLAFSDHRELVNHPDVDVVTVSLRVPSHYRTTMDALEAGKHVYTEWPLGATLREAEEMAALARAKGVRVMVGLQSRGSPPHLYLKELVEDGYVGDVLVSRMQYISGGSYERTSDRTWQRDKSAGANPMTIAFGHAVDVFCHALGSFAELSTVVSTQVPQWYETDNQRFVDVTSPDNVLVSGRLQGGAVASVHVGNVHHHASGYRLEVYGTEGTLVTTGPQGPNTGQVTVMGGKAGGDLEELPVPGRLAWVPEETSQGAPFNVAQMYRRFGEAILHGENAQPDFDDAVSLHKLLDAIQQSSDEGRRVTIDAAP